MLIRSKSVVQLLSRSFLNCTKKPENWKIFPKYYSTNNAKKSEHESIKEALEVDSLRKAASNTDGQIKTEKRMLIGFTCKQCQHRTHRTMSHHAYNHGIVLIECPGCHSRHLIADNLGWFKDTPKAAKKIEDMTDLVGEIRKSLNLNGSGTDGSGRGLVELLKD